MTPEGYYVVNEWSMANHLYITMVYIHGYSYSQPLHIISD
jgi:hypothetical protein